MRKKTGRLLYGLLLRTVCRPCVRYGETDDLAREAAYGTRHECQVIAGPVTKDDIARAATDPLALAFIVDRHWGGSCLTYGAEEDVLCASSIRCLSSRRQSVNGCIVCQRASYSSCP